jgi:hypothetical protein
MSPNDENEGACQIKEVQVLACSAKLKVQVEAKLMARSQIISAFRAALMSFTPCLACLLDKPCFQLRVA